MQPKPNQQWTHIYTYKHILQIMVSLFRTISVFYNQKTPKLLRSLSSTPSMSIRLKTQAFAGSPFKPKTPKTADPLSPAQAFETLKTRLLETTTGHVTGSPEFKVLPFRKGRPLAGSDGGAWRLGWIGLDRLKELDTGHGTHLSSVGEGGGESLVYLGSESGGDGGDGAGVVYWAVDVSEEGELVGEFGGRMLSFVELRTLMVATDWDDESAMGQLAIAGHARALLEWHNVSKFCGRCGEKNVSKEAGRRKQCSNDSCGFRVYPRVDPVVIMLVIDRENDRALLSRQSRFVPRMWSCLAGFMEPGESLEEAVRRETWEETGIEVGEVIYHSSQPWPVGPSTIPCQLMVGFHAYAKSLEINVDKSELEDAVWHSREEVKKALLDAEYKKAQRTAAAKVEQMCKGVERGQNFSADFNVESGELVPMFFPGPFAIAHHLISSWAFRDEDGGTEEAQVKQLSSSISNL